MHNIRNRSNPAPRMRLDPSVVWEDRKTLVMREAEAKRAADDAKTVRLRALRLEKEAADAAEAATKAKTAPAPKPRKTTRRVVS
jgi:hypothetical protein